MAIHNDYPGPTVQIISDGKPLDEYVYEEEEEEEEEEAKTTTRYIECQSHTEFAIETIFKPPFSPLDLAIQVRLDGVKVSGVVAHKEEMLNKTYTQSATKWKEGGKWQASKFVFSDLCVVQEESETLTEENLDALSHVGTISVALIPITSIRRDTKSKCKKKELRALGMISEDAMKGDVRSQVIGLAPALATKAPRLFSIKKAAEPLVTFKFKYRSISALKSLGIVPRSPSPCQDTRPELVKKTSTPELSPKFCPDDASPTVTPAADTASVAPVLLQQNSTPTDKPERSNLTKRDMLILIKHYRGSSDGLEGLTEKDLAILLSSYRGDRLDDTPIKKEPVPPESRVRIKRDLVEDVVARGQGKKRKMEIIVLDD
ncbi:hypothetical protein ACET3X_003960 [Alternaria dauci]|uniref:DUF7918 domain-containing protein n=1 Tax=Alternaria dauci TaxID=48095 RepID=A0ABR3UNF5_9PLEO